MAKKTRTSSGAKTLEQREAYHQTALKKIAVRKQIAELRKQLSKPK
jgi:hypothetical protein